jgi:hypothetical protein
LNNYTESKNNLLVLKNAKLTKTEVKEIIVFAEREILKHGLNAGDSEMQAAVSQGLRRTEWGELASPILQSLQMAPISEDVRERLESIYARLKP